MSRILLVEDDSSLSMGIEFALRREDFEVEVAHQISEARERWSKAHYDLLLMDVMLPDGNGYELCRHIRQSSDIPIIFLTACDEEVNIVLGLDIGADDYITKPFRVKELISRIKAVIRRKPQAAGTAGIKSIRSGSIELLPMQTKVKKNHIELALTPAEYKLLAALLMNPQQSLSREQILEKLWDIEGEFVDDNTLSVYIRRLREKLEDDPSHPEYIVTVRGLGYKWDKPLER